MASIALSFSTEPTAGLRFPFSGYCFYFFSLLNYVLHIFVMDRGVLFFSKSLLILS